MLALGRQVGEIIRIGDDIEIHVIDVRRNLVRIGIKAPRGIQVDREEIFRRKAEESLLREAEAAMNR